jgi:hypothetical protein
LLDARRNDDGCFDGDVLAHASSPFSRDALAERVAAFGRPQRKVRVGCHAFGGRRLGRGQAPGRTGGRRKHATRLADLILVTIKKLS